MVRKVNVRHLTAVEKIPEQNRDLQQDESWWMVERKAYLKDAVERLRLKDVSVHDLSSLLSNIRYALRHAHSPLYSFMSSITSLEEINNLENKIDVHFVQGAITSLKQCGYWPFLPGIAEVGVNQKVQKAVLKKVLSVLPLLRNGWASLGITEGELRRCVVLAPYLHKKYVVSKTLFNVVEMSKLYPDIKQKKFAEEIAEATTSANELRYRVGQGEFTFAELYTTEKKIEQTLNHINKALAKLAP